MRVLGVDPGLTRCGVGVVDGSAGRAIALVDVQVIRTPADAPIERRLLTISDELERLVRLHRPDAVAIERVFSQQNVRSVMGTAQAAGAAMVAAARAQLPVALHTPTEVKAAITGNGAADKAQVGAMVARLLKLPEAPRPADAADALALAICHAWRGPAQQLRDAAVQTAAVRAAAVRASSVRAAARGAAAGGPSTFARPGGSR